MRLHKSRFWAGVCAGVLAILFSADVALKAAESPLVRVRVLSNFKITQLKLSANRNFSLVDQASSRVITVCAGEVWQVVAPNVAPQTPCPLSSSVPTQLSGAGAAGSAAATAVSPSGFSLLNPQGDSFPVGGPLKIVPGEGDETGPPAVTLITGGKLRRYRGEMEVRFKDGEFICINALPLEDYLLGVVADEIPPSWPAEALKAQAILARTYALNHLGSSPRAGYDLVDTVADQVYGGLNAEEPAATAAVRQTAGLVVGYQGGIARSVFYFSTCGGMTEDVANVWGADVPYLKGVSCGEAAIPVLSEARALLPAGEGDSVSETGRYGFEEGRGEKTANSALPASPLADLSQEAAVTAFLKGKNGDMACAASPWYRWQVRFTQAELQQILNANLSGLLKQKGIQVGEILALEVTRRSRAGRVLQLAIKTTTGTFTLEKDDVIRNAFKKNGIPLRSNFFIIEVEAPIEPLAVTEAAAGGVRENGNAAPAPPEGQTFPSPGSPSSGPEPAPSPAPVEGQTTAAPAAFIFLGAGSGHGVGVCQYGMRGMALQGATAAEILAHFLPGTNLLQLY